MNNLKNKLDTSGIYGILCKITNKWYIGQARNMLVRSWEHKKRLRKNKGDCPKLQRAWNKYKEHNFEFYPLCPCLISHLDAYEKLFINCFDSIKNGYNIFEGGRGGHPKSGSIKNMATGEIVKFESIVEVCAKYGLNKSSISSLLNKKINIHKGWCHIDRILIPYVFEKDGTRITITDLDVFAKNIGIRVSILKYLISGRYKQFQGWEYITERPLSFYRYKFLNLDKQIIVGHYLKDIAKKYNLHAGCLSDVWCGRSKTHKGWVKYVEPVVV